MRVSIVFMTCLLPLIFGGCTGLKRSQTAVSRGIMGHVDKEVSGHRVVCSQGPVCSEVDVLRISAEDRDNGKVSVTLENRTGNTALVQVVLEIVDASGEMLTSTRPENVSIPGHKSTVYSMPGVYKKGAMVRVKLNVAY